MKNKLNKNILDLNIDDAEKLNEIALSNKNFLKYWENVIALIATSIAKERLKNE